MTTTNKSSLMRKTKSQLCEIIAIQDKKLEKAEKEKERIINDLVTDLNESETTLFKFRVIGAILFALCITLAVMLFI